MAVNLINRTPVPGSFGAPVDSGVQLSIQVTGLGHTVALSTVVIKINTIVAFTGSVFQTGYSGTAVTDGLGGWVFNITPVVDFAFDSDITIEVDCTEQPGSIPFSQTYSFHTIRDIQLAVTAEYSEEGDVTDIGVYVHEGETLVPRVATNISVRVFNASQVAGAAPVQSDIITFTPALDSLDANGAFFIRVLHPLKVSRNMTCIIDVITDPYQAPGVGQLSFAGLITYQAKTVNPTTAEQPFPEGEIHRPRIEYEDGLHNKSFQIAEADYEKVNITDSDFSPDTLVSLNFLDSYNYSIELGGNISYLGGGNRLLPRIDKPDQYILQTRDEFPTPDNARLMLEPQTTNIFPNSALIVEANPFIITTTDVTVNTTKDLLVLLTDLDSVATVNQAHFTLEGMTIYDGTTRHAVLTSPAVAYSTGNPVAVSFFCRTTFRDSTVTLKNFTLRANFFNTLGALVYTQSVVYSPHDFESLVSFSLAEIEVASGSIPGSAVKVGFSIDIDSFEACDRMELWLVGPSIEYKTYTSSRAVSAGTTAVRLADNLFIQQTNNINIEEGRIVITYAPSYDTSPPVVTTLFDTRLPSTLFNGYTASHRLDGRIEFDAVTAGGGVQAVVTTSPVVFNRGESVTLEFSWNATTLHIKQGSILLGSFSGSYVQPNSINSFMKIGCDANQANQLLGEIHTFQVYNKFVN